ncbi:MAG: ABC transporter permease [Methanofollis sp.]|uniref:ABC transporter permease n=1 Tax=Methanofollis sp. TaxID=2052835 RepID=UPI002602204A|nr:ABC transporter permease [Methanofollis sp.]MDD4254873.1 ABC transporter permease [Methanofollis sp.]
MHHYIIKRIGYLLLTLVIASMFTFVVVNAIPGEPAEILTKHIFVGLEEAAPPEMVAEISERYDLNRPLMEQYLAWVGGMLHGDLGYSFLFNKPVTRLLKNALPPTLMLAAAAVALSLLIGLPLGICSALRQGRISDWIIRLASIFSVSMPSFWVAVMLILVFSIWLDITPVAGYGGIEFLVLPAFALAIHSAASITRIMRTSLLETMEKPFITFARAKGLPTRRVIADHAFRNALLPVLTVVGMSFGSLLAGTVVIETIFSWPGLGSLLLKAISARDAVLIESTIMVIVFMFLIVNFVIDLLYHVIDPRITYE